VLLIFHSEKLTAALVALTKETQLKA